MTTRFTGGCICGGVRYECVADPIAMGIAIAVLASERRAALMLQR